MSVSTCAYCGGEFVPTYGVRRYCGPKCASDYWRLGHADPSEGTPSWQGLDDHSDDAWDQKTRYSPSAFVIERHVATCMSCGRTVEATDRAAWCRAVRTLQCEPCAGRLLFEPEGVGSLRSTDEGLIRKKTNDTPRRTHAA